MIDPNNDEHRLIISANTLDPNLIDSIGQILRDEPGTLRDAINELTRMEIADLETIKSLIKEFSGLQICVPIEGLKDLQIIEKAQVGIQIAFMQSPDRFGVIIAFHVPLEPGIILFRPLSVGGLEVRLHQEDGQLLEPKVKGNAEGFVFEIKPGNKFTLKLSL